MRYVAISSLLMLAVGSAHAERKRDLREYVEQAVLQIDGKYHDKGYSHGAYFTHNLDYGAVGNVPASALHPKTMCVAAVTEVIITALELYAEKEHDRSIFDLMPSRTWVRTTRDDIRPYLFMFSTVKSNGTADALEQFGIGVQTPFAELLPGDFINLNREKTGHAVVFMGFIDATGELVKTYDATKVVGFKYFSSQGSNPGGFGYRWAYFNNHCPAKTDPAKPRDCGVQWSPRYAILDTGYLLHPSLWRVKDARSERKQQHLETIVERSVGVLGGPEGLDRLGASKQLELVKRADAEYDQELSGTAPPKYSGATTDD